LETHGALVFLAGEEAWKIKRAVRFPYMDFSTLEKRRVASAREVEINKRLAPRDLYWRSTNHARQGWSTPDRRQWRDRRMGGAHAPL
jgi:aminoglycoside phosphotransferase family enzyme